ncbi:hypothetical protein [Actinomadura parmotrematis]|uniref:Uncharacterized protein n=1 Tax=Actinomadura parmotrematis TaxID=2864039 RepID=A0ABS7FVY5_9ACTN|nr:hypothetical protein [Actinomadura parmotrematis]MBW8484330.1 hypothetical protein [Actinomadura parmotrematis]
MKRLAPHRPAALAAALLACACAPVSPPRAPAAVTAPAVPPPAAPGPRNGLRTIATYGPHSGSATVGTFHARKGSLWLLVDCQGDRGLVLVVPEITDMPLPCVPGEANRTANELVLARDRPRLTVRVEASPGTRWGVRVQQGAGPRLGPPLPPERDDPSPPSAVPGARAPRPPSPTASRPAPSTRPREPAAVAARRTGMETTDGAPGTAHLDAPDGEEAARLVLAMVVLVPRGDEAERAGPHVMELAARAFAAVDRRPLETGCGHAEGHPGAAGPTFEEWADAVRDLSHPEGRWNARRGEWSCPRHLAELADRTLQQIAPALRGGGR